MYLPEAFRPSRHFVDADGNRCCFSLQYPILGTDPSDYNNEGLFRRHSARLKQKLVLRDTCNDRQHGP